MCVQSLESPSSCDSFKQKWGLLRGLGHPLCNSTCQSALSQGLDHFKPQSTARSSGVYKALIDQKKQLWIFFRHSQTGLDRARQASCYRSHSIPGYCLFNELQNSASDICTNWVGMEQLSTTSLHRLYHWHWFSFQSGRNRRNLHFCHCHLQEFPAVHAEKLVIVAFQIIKEGKKLSAGLTCNASPLRSRLRSLCCF